MGWGWDGDEFWMARYLRDKLAFGKENCFVRQGKGVHERKERMGFWMTRSVWTGRVFGRETGVWIKAYSRKGSMERKGKTAVLMDDGVALELWGKAGSLTLVFWAGANLHTQQWICESSLLGLF